MAYAADYFDVFKKNIAQADQSRFPIEEQVKGYFEDILLDPDFDQIGVLDEGGPEFEFYRELDALPENYS